MSLENVNKKNNINVIGTLVEVKLEEATSKTGKDYISGSIIVKSVLKDREQLTEIRLLSMALKKDGTPNKLFESYKNLNQWLNKRVSVNGELSESRFYSERDSQVASFGQIEGRFVSLARTTETEDKAEFVFGGIVVKPLAERLNKKEELLGYEISLLQPAYLDKPRLIKFFVDKDHKPAISFITSNYAEGSTVEINGEIRIVTESNTVEEAVAFGDPVIKHYTNTIRNFLIKSGSQPILGLGEYLEEDIVTLVNRYKEDGVSIADEAKNQTGFSNGASTVTKAADTVKKANYTSLL